MADTQSNACTGVCVGVCAYISSSTPFAASKNIELYQLYNPAQSMQAQMQQKE